MKILPLSEGVLEKFRGVINDHFLFDAETYRGYTAAEYHKVVADAQDYMRRNGMAELLVTPSLKLKLHPVYLRATRPNVEGQEVVGWHREEFYGAPKGILNLWVPIKGVTVENTLRYVPDSDKIPDEEIITDQCDDPEIHKGSDGNKIGLLYSPKTIIAGVDFDKAVPLEVPYGSAALFSGSLIHGAAINRTKEIRFSVDLRLSLEGK